MERSNRDDAQSWRADCTGVIFVGDEHEIRFVECRSGVDLTLFDGDKLDGLVESMLRTLQSFIVDPGGPARQGDGLRAYLRDWVAPAVRARADSP